MHIAAISPVMQFSREYQRRRDAWALSDGPAAGRAAASDAAEIWRKLLETRAAHPAEVAAKMALLIELLVDDLPEGCAALAMAASIQKDLAGCPVVEATLPLAFTRPALHPLDP